MSEFTDKIEKALELLKSKDINEDAVLELLSSVLNDEEGCKEFFKDKYKGCLGYSAAAGYLSVMQMIWEKMGPSASCDEINPKDEYQDTPLHWAAKNGHLSVVQAILDKISPNASSDEINPKDNIKKTPLHYAAENGHLNIVQAIWEKMGPNASIAEINPKDILQRTPLHLAAKNGHLNIVQAILVKMGPSASIGEINPENDFQETPLYFAVLYGHSDVVKAILDKMGPNASSDEINPKIDIDGATPLHWAAEYGHLNIVQAILAKMGPNASIDEINPKDKYQGTPLLWAARIGRFNIVLAILDKMSPDASSDEINPKGYQGRTPLYYASERQKFDVIHALLDYELIEVNYVGPLSLLTFFSADSPDSNRVRERLRQLGCLDIPEVNQDPDARLVQDTQGIHASGVEKGINRSLEKLRVGKDASAVSSSYEDFIKYCNLSNPAFVKDLRAIKVNSQNFSRNLIVKALSVTDGMSEQEKADVEKLKLSLFNDAVSHQISNMTLYSNSADFVASFKERLGLIWGELNNPECWRKFPDLKEIMDKEGEAFSKDNPSAEFKSALQKLRNVLFIQLIETRYEYAVGVNTKSDVPTREEYLDALEQSRPSCAGGTNNFIVECFSHRHQDIEVLAGRFTPDFTPDATLPIRIVSKLYELILASVNTRTEIRTRVDSETKIQSIEGISIINELLDRMAGASDKVKKVLPQDTILLEDRIREYFRTGSIPGHSRAIGLLLGLLKQTLHENQDIIGGLPLQPNEDREEALIEAFRHLEQALANSQPGFLIQALTEARSQYYQNFFKDNLDEQKLNRFVKILKGNEGADIDERELIRAALIESYGEVVVSNEESQKIITPEKMKIIKETPWYKAVVSHMVSESQVQAQSSGNMLYHANDLTKKLDEMLGLKLRAEELKKEPGFKAISELEEASSSAVLFSKNEANTNAPASLEGEPEEPKRDDLTLKGKKGL